MTREEREELNEGARMYAEGHINEECSRLGFIAGYEYAEEYPSDGTIMRILNAVGYEDTKWIDFVRKRLDSNGTM